MNTMLLVNSKRKIVIVSATVILLSGGILAMANQKPVGATTSPLVGVLQDQDNKLKNHEARLSNLETDTRILQTATGTPPSNNKTSVPSVPASTAAPSDISSTVTTPSDTPTVTVTGFKEIVLDQDNSDCEYTYSDGSKKQFAWKRTNLKGAWIADSFGNNGHFEKTVQETGYCDSRAIGLQKD